MEASPGWWHLEGPTELWQRGSVVSPWFWASGASGASQKVFWDHPPCHCRVLDTSADVCRWENTGAFFKEEETQNKLEQDKIQSLGWNSASGMLP